MNKEDIKKIIATAIATGAILGGGSSAVNKINCVYTVSYQGKEICIDKELKGAMESQLKTNAGTFGGVRFKEVEK